MTEQKPFGRRRRRQQFDTTVPSPCVAVCQFRPDEEICVGCLRNADEIREWMIMTREQKLAVLEAIKFREKDSQH